ncbi:MAG: hypothetical protein NT121_18310 [Chloroflexi bacterium]|nr:hypothetical protein [Chloroflexota bacterium]
MRFGFSPGDWKIPLTGLFGRDRLSLEINLCRKESQFMSIARTEVYSSSCAASLGGGLAVDSWIAPASR